MLGAMMPHILGNSHEIVQAPGLVAIRYELVHDVRIIPLDARPHVSKAIEFEMGDTRGHWEGNALVVESTNYKDRSTYRNANAATLKPVERFYANVAWQSRLGRHGKRPDDVDAAVDVLNAVDEDRHRAGARVRVPRRQLRGAAHSERRLHSRARPASASKP